MTISPIFGGTWTIAKNSYKEIVRDRLLYGMLLIAALVAGASFFAGSISFDQGNRVTQDIGVAAIHLFALFICIFTATNSISHDFERRTLYLLFAKPVSRAAYVLGKYLGIVLLLLSTLALLGGLFMLGLAFFDHALLLGTLVDLIYSFLELSLITAFAVLFSSFTAPLNAALYSAALFIIGHSLGTVRSFMTIKGSSVVTIKLIGFCYYVFPNLEKFDIRRSVLYGLYPPASSVLWTLLYWALYTALALYLAIRAMEHQEV